MAWYWWLVVAAIYVVGVMVLFYAIERGRKPPS